MSKVKDITNKIKKGILDCNDRELFLKILIKGLLVDLNKEIFIRNISVPHIILNTGDDLLFLANKGYDKSKEPIENTNENYIYNIIPRCIVNPQGIDLLSDQLTSPYTRGIFEFQTDDDLYTFSAEFRRIPMKLSVNLKYYTDTFNDMMHIIQLIITKMSFVRVFNISYMGQVIKCSYKIPESFQDEHNIEFTGDIKDNVCKSMELSLEVETNIPVFNPRTIMDSTIVITNCDPPKIGDAYNIKNM